MSRAATPVEELAVWVAGVDPGALDAGVAGVARLSLVDTVGVMIAGAREPLSRRIAEHAMATRGAGPCRVVAADGRTASALAAALANGAAAHVLDFDDTIYEGIAHPSAPTLPAALAAAELAGTSDVDVLAGLAAGIEVMAALGRLFTDRIYERGVWTTAFLGAISAAAGAARAMRLDAEATGRALAMAAGQAAGSRTVMGTDAKPYQCGRAAETGLDAALAARAGLSAPAQVLDGRFGLLGVLAQESAGRRALDDLGRASARPILGYKLFPLCSAAQAAAEAVQTIAAEHGVTAAEVAWIGCRVTPFVAGCLPYDRPASQTQAQFSLPFAVACTLARGTISPPHLAGEYLAEEVRDLMSKVSTMADVKLADAALEIGSLEAASVTIVTAHGARFERTVLAASGLPPNRARADVIETKFLANCEPTAGAHEARRLLESLRSIDVRRPRAAGSMLSARGL